MSNKVRDWVRDESEAKGTAYHLHLALADRANDDGFCWPSQERLALDLRTSVETVRRATRQLEERGYVLVKPYSGRKHQHCYQLCLPWNASHITAFSPHTVTATTPQPVGVNPVNLRGVPGQPAGATPSDCGQQPHTVTDKPSGTITEPSVEPRTLSRDGEPPSAVEGQGRHSIEETGEKLTHWQWCETLPWGDPLRGFYDAGEHTAREWAAMARAAA